MRTLSPTAQVLLARLVAGERVPIVHLVQVDTDPPMYLTTAGAPLQWDGHTWQPVGVSVEPIGHSASGEVESLQFVLPAVTEDQLAVALLDQVDGIGVTVRDAIVDPATAVVADAPLAWAGTLNTPTITDGDSGAAVAWTAEHSALRALRPKPSRYTDAEQRRLYPGDTSLDIDPATDAAPIVWPAASFFRV